MRLLTAVRRERSRWLHWVLWSRRRVRGEVGFALGLVLGAAILVGTGMVQRRAELLPVSDFGGIWAGARAIVVGADPYDPSTWAKTTERLGTQRPDTAVYGYPPHVALALVPLAMLPHDVAGAIWTASGIALAVIGLGALVRRGRIGPFASALLGMALLGSQPALTAFMVSQWSFHLTGALALAAAWRSDRPRLGLTAVTVAALAKPQLFAFALPAIARRPMALALAAVGALAVVAVATMVYPHWVSAWTTAVAPVRISDPPRSATLLGLSGELFGRTAVPVWLIAVATLAGVAHVSGAGLAAWLTLSVVAAPYGWSYDHLVLLVPIALVLGGSERARRPLYAGAAVVILLALAPATYAVAVMRGRETLSAVIPLAVLAFVLVASADRDRLSRLAARWPRLAPSGPRGDRA